MNTEHPTAYPALNALLRELVTSVQEVLNENFVGAYLQGSLAIGDFDEHSDIDFLVLVEKDVTETELAELQAVHARIYNLFGKYVPDCPVTGQPMNPRHWETSLEGSYIPQNMLRRHDKLGNKHWYLDNGSIVFERSDHDDTLVVRWTLRERGIILSGPNPKSIMDPIPAHSLCREVLATMRTIQSSFGDAWWNSRFGQPFAVMTYCRMLQTLETGIIHSKLQSVAWGKQQLDKRWTGLIQRAWEARGHGHVSEPADPDEYSRTLEFMAYATEYSSRHGLGL